MSLYDPQPAKRVVSERSLPHNPLRAFVEEWVTLDAYEIGYEEDDHLVIEETRYWYFTAKSICRGDDGEMWVCEKIDPYYATPYSQLRMPWAVGMRLLRSYANETLSTREIAGSEQRFGNTARVVVGNQQRRHGLTIIAPCGQATFLARKTALSLVELLPKLKKPKVKS